MTDEPELDIKKLQQRISENPDDAAAYSSLGTALTSQHHLQEAGIAFEKALRLNPKDSHAELALCMLVYGPDPLFKPSADLLKFLGEHGGSIVKIMQEAGGIPRVADAEPPVD